MKGSIRPLIQLPFSKKNVTGLFQKKEKKNVTEKLLSLRD
jgi:hypothetical protein